MLPGRGEHVRLGAFRKHNPFQIAPRLLEDTADDSHGALSSRPLTKLQLKQHRNAVQQTQYEQPTHPDNSEE